ncbi:ATP-dependent nuclease [Aliivibrio fischeri]|uniref:ATP-dependent nuclease n=1 Tax=Aliivibrio fischeri TaxID=668 RepID=UPI0012DAC936|nr:ATP-binding protein [Aliivibrio fischeri]MUK70193.1 AAA family ATPase [Aliivibrio fischeri]MUK72727.1 AAA family ATPase [Aliivibrio fischeri]
MTTNNKIDYATIINRVKLPNSKTTDYQFISDSGTWDLENLNKINFFVGANNSGKSRVLRYILNSEYNKWIIDSNIAPCEEIIKKITSPEFRLSFREKNMPRLSYHTYSVSQAIESILKSSPPLSINLLTKAIYTNMNSSAFTMDEDIKSIHDYIITPASNKDKLDIAMNLDNIYSHKVYIPTLRTLRHINNEDYYIQRTKNDYFNGRDYKDITIFTGHSIAEDLKEHLLGDHQQREKVRQYEHFLSEKFFYGADIALTPRIKDNVVYFKEGSKDERPIYDLGDGIQAIIILTYKVFMANEPTLFFIEEPEKYLHAGMQRTLIKALTSIRNHMFFMTTHSNHFLDLALERNDISTHQVFQENKKTVVKSSAKLTELLDDLGVRGSSVLLANSSIWVEGITDKLYLRTYMNKFLSELESTDKARSSRLKSFHENLHFVFIEYQGSNITHWAFCSEEASEDKTSADLLNNKIFLLADGDIDWKGERTENLEQYLGDNFHQLDYKEIENYLPENVLKKTARLRWEKFKQTNDCNLDLSTLTQAEYAHKSKGIGSFLEQYVTKPKHFDKSFFEETKKSSTGTIRDKVKFCHEAVNYMNDNPDGWQLTPELSKLCDILWQHIETSN